MRTAFIVTGGAGFIGSNLVATLNARGHDDILVVDHLNHPLKERNLAALRHRGFMDKGAFRAALRTGGVAVGATVFHLGACSSTTQLDEDYLRDNNLDYTRELCDWTLAQGARFIYASSAATYGDGALGYRDDESLIPRLQPLNPYGRSKQEFDRWALDRGLLRRIAGLKYFNVYGPGEAHKSDMRSVINKAHRQILDTGEMTLFKSHRPDYRDGEQTRDFVYVRDAVAMTLFFHDRPDVNGLFNAGTGAARTWLDLARALFAALERPPRIRFIPMPEVLRERYQYHTEADMTRLRTAGYAAPVTSVEDGVRDYVTRGMETGPIREG